MIKTINNARDDTNKVLVRIETQATFERLKVDRSESSFGGKASLTHRELAKGNRLVERSRQVTAW